MLGFNSTVQEANFKRYYAKKGPEIELAESGALLALAKMSPETGKGTGRSYDFAIFYEGPRNSHSIMSKALTRARSNRTQGVQLSMRYDDFYQPFYVNGKAILASRDKEGAFTEQLRLQADPAMEVFFQGRSQHLWEDGFGSLGQIKAKGTDTVTLAQKRYHLNLGKGDSIEFVDETDSAAARAGGPYIITKIDRQTGVITFDKNINSAVTTTDYMKKSGEVGASKIYMTGLPAWVPKTVADSDNFFGINRSVDRTRLAGTYIEDTAANKSLEDKILDACAEHAFLGGKITTILCGPRTYTNVIKEIGAKVEYMKEDSKGSSKAIAGFGGVEIHTANSVMSGRKGDLGAVTLMRDNYAPENEFYGFQEKELCIKNLGTKNLLTLQKFDTQNGYLRASDTEDYEARMIGHSLFGYKKPVNLLRLVTST